MYQRQLAKVRWSILTSNCSSTSSCHGISWTAPWQFERTAWWHFRFMFRCPIYVPTLGVSTYRWHMLWRQTAGGPSPGSWKPSVDVSNSVVTVVVVVVVVDLDLFAGEKSAAVFLFLLWFSATVFQCDLGLLNSEPNMARSEIVVIAKPHKDWVNW